MSIAAAALSPPCCAFSVDDPSDRHRSRGVPMIVYVARRLILLIPILVGMTLISFTVSRAIPTDPVVATLGQQAAEHPEIVAAYRRHWGLDRPLVDQYLIYLGHLAHGDLGESIYTHRPVIDDLRSYL